MELKPVIFAAGTINLAKRDLLFKDRSFEKGHSFIRQVNNIDDVREGESFLVINNGSHLEIYSGECLNSTAKIKEGIRILLDFDMDELSSCYTYKDYYKEIMIGKAMYKEHDILMPPNSSHIMINIADGDYNVYDPNKVKPEKNNISDKDVRKVIRMTKDFKKQKDNFKVKTLRPGINIRVVHTPKENTFGSEFFDVEVLATDKFRDSYIIHMSGLEALCEDEFYKNDILFSVDNNNLKEANLYRRTDKTFTCFKGLFNEEATMDTYLQDHNHKINNLISITREYSLIESSDFLTIQRISIQPDGSIKYNELYEIPSFKTMNRKVIKNFTQDDKFIDNLGLKGKQYQCVNMKNMSKVKKEVIDQGNLDFGEYILLSADQNYVTAKVINICNNTVRLLYEEKIRYSQKEKDYIDAEKDGLELGKISRRIKERSETLSKDF